MTFWSAPIETPLSKAVIHDDLETIEALKGRKDYLLAPNGLGFSALELAYYLDRGECLRILQPRKERRFRVVIHNESQVREVNEGEFESLFHARYIAHLKFRDYDLFKKVIKACPSAFQGLAVEIPRGDRREWEGRGETPQSASIRGALYRQDMLAGTCADIAIRWIDDVLGYGVFAEQPITKGEYIGEFAGVVRSAHWLRPGLNAYCLRYPSKIFSGFLPAYYLVDAKDAGNEIRFVNHSYQPNLVPKVAVQHGLVHQLFLLLGIFR